MYLYIWLLLESLIKSVNILISMLFVVKGSLLFNEIISFLAKEYYIFFCCSIAQSCPTLCTPMHCSMPGSPVLHSLPEFAQTLSIDSVMPSNHLSPTIPPALNLSQHQRFWPLAPPWTHRQLCLRTFAQAVLALHSGLPSDGPTSTALLLPLLCFPSTGSIWQITYLSA